MDKRSLAEALSSFIGGLWPSEGFPQLHEDSWRKTSTACCATDWCLRSNTVCIHLSGAIASWRTDEPLIFYEIRGDTQV